MPGAAGLFFLPLRVREPAGRLGPIRLSGDMKN